MSAGTRRRRWSPLLGCLAVGALVLVAAPPAAANHVGIQNWSAPADGTTIAGNVGVKFQARATVSPLTGGSLRSVTVELLTGNDTYLRTLCSSTIHGETTSEYSVDVTWNSRALPATDATSSCATGDVIAGDSTEWTKNGPYKVKVIVVASSVYGTSSAALGHVAESIRTVRLENGVAAPTGVKAGFDANTQKATVVWDTAPEPDVVGYTVEQCKTGSELMGCTNSDWKAAASPDSRTSTTALVGVSGAGAYRYRVQAIRRDGALESTVKSAWTTTTPMVLEVDETGKPVQDPDSGGNTPGTGGGGGGGSGADPTSSTTPGGGGSGGSEGPGGDGGSSGSGGGSGGDRVRGQERQRALEPRLIQRAGADGSYSDTLPYGARPVEEVASGPTGLLAGEGPVGVTAVPIAGGLLLFVVAMQLRYLGRRAAPSTAGGAIDALVVDERPAPTRGRRSGSGRSSSTRNSDGPAAEPAAAVGMRGSFVRTWRRWLDD